MNDLFIGDMQALQKDIFRSVANFEVTHCMHAICPESLAAYSPPTNGPNSLQGLRYEDVPAQLFDAEQRA